MTAAIVAEANLALLSVAEVALATGDLSMARMNMQRFDAAWPARHRPEGVARRASVVDAHTAPIPRSIAGPALAP